MPLAVNFRWKGTNVQAKQPDTALATSITQAAQAIQTAKDRRFNRDQAERRNAIEDEERARRIAEEDRRKKVYGDAAEIMRGKARERAALVSEAERLRSEIAELQAQVGG